MVIVFLMDLSTKMMMVTKVLQMIYENDNRSFIEQ
jgi:hypothetical protein